MKTGILVSGNFNMDQVVHPVDELVWGGTIVVDAIERRLGGNGANTSYAIGKLGMKVRSLGGVGSDEAGDYVLGELRSAGVDVSAMRRCGPANAITIGLVKPSGARAFLNWLGSSALVDLTPEEMLREFRNGFAHYHMASPFGLPRLRPKQPEFLRLAREAGLTTSLDTHWDWAGAWMDDLGPCLAHTDILFVNEDEARMLGGIPALRAAGARTLVLKLGAEGCEVMGEGGNFRMPAFEVPVVDTTGAGDCFSGGFLVALQRGASFAEAARFANAVGALSVRALGSVAGMLDYEGTLEWISKRGAAGREPAQPPIPAP